MTVKKATEEKRVMPVQKKSRLLLHSYFVAGTLLVLMITGFTLIADRKHIAKKQLTAITHDSGWTQASDSAIVASPPIEKKLQSRKADKKIKATSKDVTGKPITPGISEKDSNQSNTNPSARPELGAYRVKSKAYFHNQPNELSKRNAFIVHWNNAILHPIEERNDFVYIVYTNHKGQTSKGWLSKKDLVRLD